MQLPVIGLLNVGQRYGCCPTYPAAPIGKLAAVVGGLGKVAKGAISFSEKQLGKKLGKHVGDFGGNPANAADRQRVIDRINDIANNPDRVVPGSFRGQSANGGRGSVNFMIQGNDIVVTTPSGEFVTILKDGINNTSVQNALKGL